MKTIKQTLSTQQQKLLNKIAALKKDISQSHSADFAEQVTERENDEVLQNLLNEALIELNQINNALHRIEMKTFGTCAKCGDAIGNERLEILPYTQFCRDCAG